MASELLISLEKAIELLKNHRSKQGLKCLVNARAAFFFPKKSPKKCVSIIHQITTDVKL
jgi:hypothetical protein